MWTFVTNYVKGERFQSSSYKRKRNSIAEYLPCSRFITICLFVYVPTHPAPPCACVCVCVHPVYGECYAHESRKATCRNSALPPSCWSWGLNSGFQAWQQALLPAEPRKHLQTVSIIFFPVLRNWMCARHTLNHWATLQPPDKRFIFKIYNELITY